MRRTIKKEAIKKEHKKKLSYMEEKELNTLENEIVRFDERISVLKKELNNSSNDYVKLMDYQKELDEINEVYDLKSIRYLELLEKKEEM